MLLKYENDQLSYKMTDKNKEVIFVVAIKNSFDINHQHWTRRQPSQVSNDFPCQLYYEYNIATYIYI